MEFLGVVKNISLIGFSIRTFIVGLIAFIVGRFISKRAVNELTSYDFVLIWILGALIVAPLLEGEVSFTYIIVPLITLFFWHYLFSSLCLKSRSLSLFLNGKPVILIDNGTIIRKNLKKHFINVDLLMSELRVKNIFDISEAKYAILEPSGQFSVIKRESNRSVTPENLNLSVKPVNFPLVIINDGKLFEENLIESGLDKQWLMNNLAVYNVHHIEDIYIATVDSYRKLFVFKKDQ
ncbi:MAG: hypothetical protein K0R54_1379 [Clostridiaceae bacterium]|nr:hypothetical protein [Clostridiaceae bacterium]